MKTTKYNWILYLITATIVITIGVQFYWNYKNYEENKRIVLNEIQLSLDNAVEIYFSELSRDVHMAIVNTNKDSINFFKRTNNPFKVILAEFTEKNKKLKTNYLKRNIKIIKGRVTNHKKKDTNRFKVFRGKKAIDSLRMIKKISSIIFSVKNDSLNHTQLDSILRKQLNDKKINITHSLEYYKQDSLAFKQQTSKNIELPNIIKAKSTFLGNRKMLKMNFSNPTKEALKRSSSGILLSFLLSLAVISSLFYLLKVINQQKQLSEIKNDLISNITHELKTPITTICSALEAIHNFNMIQDTQKTKSYLNISKSQLQKLQLIVEKILETATLDSEKLLLNPEPFDIQKLLKKIVAKYQLFTSDKQIILEATTEKIIANIDVFHFENALSNIIDNAVKYGGNNISVGTKLQKKQVQIIISDNGTGIHKKQQERIFDKFYRVPKGNTHDIKGFGIGLYYTQKIIQKHQGTIRLTSNSNPTTFVITIPYNA